MNKDFVMAYLDYNIIRYLQEGKTTVSAIKERLNTTTKVVFPFTASHVEEIHNISSANPKREELIRERLVFLRNLTECYNLYSNVVDKNVTYLRMIDPVTVLDTIREVSIAKISMKVLSNFINEDQRKSVRDALGVDSRTVNNYTVPQILEHLEKLASLGNMTFAEFMDKARSFHPDNDTFDFHNEYAAVFEMLDLVGYWTDTYKEDSNFARTWDASHCAYASNCEFFVTNDQKTSKKAAVLYAMYKVETQVILLR